MDYSILKGLIIAFLIQYCTSEDLTSSLQSSAVSLQDDSQALSQQQEPLGAEVIPAVAPPSLQEVQQAVQEASEKEGQGAEEVLKGLLERVVEAALGVVESAGESKVEEQGVVIVEGAGVGQDDQTGQTEEGQVIEDTGVEQEVDEAVEDGAVVLQGDSETIIDSNGREKNEEVADKNNNMEQTSDVPVDNESAVEVVVGGEPVQEVVADLSPDLVNVEQESVIEKAADEVVDTAQTVAGDALEQALDTNRLQDNEMHTGEVEGNLVMQEVDTEKGGDGVEELGDGETVIEAGSIVPKVAGGSEAGEEEAASEDTNSTKDHDQEVQENSDGESQAAAGAMQEEGLVQQSSELLPESPPPSPAQSEVEAGASTPGDERANYGNEIQSPSNDQAQARPSMDNAVTDVLILPPKLEEQLGEVNELVEEKTRNGETSVELSQEAWKIGAICAAVLLVLETVVIIVYILRNRSKNSSSRQRVCEEGSVEPEATTGGDYNDDTLPAGNGDTQQTGILDPSKVASTLLQNKDEQELQQVIPMSELLPNSAEDTANSTGEPQPSPHRRTSAL